MKMDVVIAGVGGQGNIFASLVISQYAMNKKLNVLGAETIGAAQRGGSVVSHIRISDGTIYSPLISRGQADLLIGHGVRGNAAAYASFEPQRDLPLKCHEDPDGPEQHGPG